MKNKDYYENNRALWNKKTAVHQKSDFYDLPAFKAGATALKATELKELGPLVKGKSMLHLQCHFGMDSLSWAREGAKVTAVDIAEDAIELGQALNQELGLDVTFLRSNIYDLPAVLDQQYDIIFTSYGVLCWLADIDAWAQLISRYLKPGGVFYIVEFHPTLMLFELESGQLKVEYPYFVTEEPMEETPEGTYADLEANIGHKEYFWNHSLGSIVTALIQNGLSIEFLHEFPYSHWGCFPNMSEKVKDKWYMTGFENLVPLMFSIKAKKV